MGAEKTLQTRKVSNSESTMIVMRNEHGQIVRVFDWSTVSSTSAVTVIFRQDTRRVEPVLNAKELKKSGVAFDVLAETTLEKLKARSVKVGSATLECTDDLSSLAPSYDLPAEDDKKDVVLIGKWVGGAQIALIVIALLLGHFLTQEQPQEETTVTVIKPMELEKKEKPIVAAPLKEKPKQVAVHKQTIVKKVPARIKPEPKIVTRHAPTVTKKKTVTAAVPKTAPSIESLGALGALGGISKKKQSGGGLNLNGAALARGGDSGRGGGGFGAAGAGGMTNALYGQGLIAASAGSGARAGSAGGYGTKGKGGGRQGYGDRNMVGSSGGYVAPLDSESFVSGGLTRAQIEEVILRNMGQITYCYEKGLQVEPSLKGRVAVSFVIGSGGQVTTARVQHTSVDSKQLEGCIVGKLRQFQFPRPVAGVNVEVQYPFSFRRVSAN